MDLFVRPVGVGLILAHGAFKAAVGFIGGVRPTIDKDRRQFFVGFAFPVGVGLLQFQVGVDAHIGQVALNRLTDFVDVGVSCFGASHANVKAVGVAGFSQQRLGLFHIIGDRLHLDKAQVAGGH